jgi:hypothetical protein
VNPFLTEGDDPRRFAQIIAECAWSGHESR